MPSMKKQSKLNKDIEECCLEIKDMLYSEKIKCLAARRYYDRNYLAKKKKCLKK